jgi:hypothetical protein
VFVNKDVASRRSKLAAIAKAVLEFDDAGSRCTASIGD